MYIQKDYGFWEIENIPNNYKQGSTIKEYNDGAWIKLNQEQINFRDKNKSASALEVFNMKLDKKKSKKLKPSISSNANNIVSTNRKETFKEKIKSIMKDPYKVLKRKTKWTLINWLNKL